MRNGEMHAMAVFGSAVLTAALVLPTVYLTAARASSEPPLRDMEMIEAALAYKPPNAKKSKQPQKVKAVVPEDKPEGVSRDENKKVDDKKDDKKDDKPTPPDAKTDPLAKYKRNLDEDSDTGGPEKIPEFDGSEFGFGDVTKGDPYFQKMVADLQWAAPELAKAGAQLPVGCVHLTADGKIPETKFRQQGDGDLQPLAEASLKRLKDKRNEKPEEVPTHLLRALTTKWVCFEFKVRSPG